MSGKNIVILVVIVAAVALVGWSAYRTQPPPGDGSAAPPAGRPPTSATGAVPAPTDAEKQSLREVPPPEAARAEQDAHFARVVQFAQDGTSIDVTRCANEPFVLRIKQGETLTLKNNGASEAVVELGGALHKVAPNGAATLEAGFGRGAGLFGYGCNTADGNGSAFILVTE